MLQSHAALPVSALNVFYLSIRSFSTRFLEQLMYLWPQRNRQPSLSAACGLTWYARDRSLVETFLPVCASRCLHGL